MDKRSSVSAASESSSSSSNGGIELKEFKGAIEETCGGRKRTRSVSSSPPLSCKKEEEALDGKCEKKQRTSMDKLQEVVDFSPPTYLPKESVRESHLPEPVLGLDKKITKEKNEKANDYVKKQIVRCLLFAMRSATSPQLDILCNIFYGAVKSLEWKVADLADLMRPIWAPSSAHTLGRDWTNEIYAFFDLQISTKESKEEEEEVTISDDDDVEQIELLEEQVDTFEDEAEECGKEEQLDTDPDSEEDNSGGVGNSHQRETNIDESKGAPEGKPLCANDTKIKQETDTPSYYAAILRVKTDAMTLWYCDSESTGTRTIRLAQFDFDWSTLKPPGSRRPWDDAERISLWRKASIDPLAISPMLPFVRDPYYLLATETRAEWREVLFQLVADKLDRFLTVYEFLERYSWRNGIEFPCLPDKEIDREMLGIYVPPRVALLRGNALWWGAWQRVNPESKMIKLLTNFASALSSSERQTLATFLAEEATLGNRHAQVAVLGEKTVGKPLKAAWRALANVKWFLACEGPLHPRCILYHWPAPLVAIFTSYLAWYPHAHFDADRANGVRELVWSARAAVASET